MTRTRLLLLAALAAIGAGWYVAVPPRARELPPPAADFPRAVRGSIHVHTDRSDGAGTVDEVAAAAARAKLAFVVLTDHGDGTRLPDPPAYRHGVLMIDAVEISTNQGGHVVAVGLPQSPYPLGGASRDVVEDVARMGGMAIAAHPGSPKPALRWTDWEAPIDGLEWLNGDSEWRDEGTLDLARMLLGYPFRRAESLTLSLDRPDAVLAKWDELTMRRRIVALAAADAHARLGAERSETSYAGAVAIRVPWYEHMFRAFGIAVEGVELTRDAERDAAAIVAALAAGHVYSTVDGLASPAALSFSATSGEEESPATARQGDLLPLSGPVRLRAAISAAPGTRLVLLRDGRAVAETDGAVLEHEAPTAPGVYRVEVRWPGGNVSQVPWIVSNPIYVGRQDAPAAAPPVMTRSGSTPRTIYGDGAGNGWRVENSARAAGALDVVATTTGGTELSMRYALGGARSDSPFVALTAPVAELAGYARLMFRARALQPMRLSVQLRAPNGTQDGARWARSVYLDETPRDVSIAFTEMRPQGPTSQPGPALAAVDTLMFVVDMENTKLGTGGRVWIDDVRLVRSE